MPPQLISTKLQLLDLSGCRSLTQPSDGILSLTGLAHLCLKHCSSVSSTAAWPSKISCLTDLTVLDLSGCSRLAEGLRLPELTGLTNLSELGFGGWALEQHQLSDLLERLTALQRLCLAQCVGLTAVPDAITKFTKLTELDLRDCICITALPGGLYGRRGLNLLLSPELEKVVREDEAQRRQQAVITKLATQQDTMLTTLERMSWLVLLLATATFLAFIQPPGGYNDFNVLIDGPQVCQPGHNPKAAVPGSKKFVLSGLMSRNGTISEAKQQGLEGPSQQCALFLFFFFDALSFCLSLGCVMLIVVLSMPRMQRDDDKFEAGRFWWLLLFTWGLLYFAVVAGFAAFVCSALAVFKGWHMLIIPFCLCALLLTLGFFVMIGRFKEICPDRSALWQAVVDTLFFQKHLVQDVETADPVGSNEFWGRLEQAVMQGATRSGRQLSGRVPDAARHEELERLLRKQGADRHSSTHSTEYESLDDQQGTHTEPE